MSLSNIICIIFLIVCFKDPQPIEKWTEPLDATKPSNFAHGIDYFGAVIQNSEDCLYLNIFTKEVSFEFY